MPRKAPKVKHRSYNFRMEGNLHVLFEDYMTNGDGQGESMNKVFNNLIRDFLTKKGYLNKSGKPASTVPVELVNQYYGFEQGTLVADEADEPASESSSDECVEVELPFGVPQSVMCPYCKTANIPNEDGGIDACINPMCEKRSYGADLNNTVDDDDDKWC